MKLKVILIFVFALSQYNLAQSQTKFNSFKEYEVFAKGLGGDGMKIYPNGWVNIDMGSACAGRVLFDIDDVIIKLEIKPSGVCGSDGKEPIALINFQCGKFNCVTSVQSINIGMYETGAIAIFDVEKGKLVYDFLTGFKEFCKLK